VDWTEIKVFSVFLIIADYFGIISYNFKGVHVRDNVCA